MDKSKYVLCVIQMIICLGLVLNSSVLDVNNKDTKPGRVLWKIVTSVWNGETSVRAGLVNTDSGDDSPEEVNKENVAQHEEAQERETEPEMDISEKQEGPIIPSEIGETHIEENIGASEVDSKVKENCEIKSDSNDNFQIDRDQEKEEENRVTGDKSENSESSEHDEEIFIKGGGGNEEEEGEERKRQK